MRSQTTPLSRNSLNINGINWAENGMHFGMDCCRQSDQCGNGAKKSPAVQAGQEEHS